MSIVNQQNCSPSERSINSSKVPKLDFLVNHFHQFLAKQPNTKIPTISKYQIRKYAIQNIKYIIPNYKKYKLQIKNYQRNFECIFQPYLNIIWASICTNQLKWTHRVIFLTGSAPKNSKCWEWQNPYQKSKSEPIQQQDVKF